MQKPVYNLKRTVVLVGMMGAGKTSVGAGLAKELGVNFVDTDHEIERASNFSVPELFERFGEVYFREKESQVLARLLREEPQVLSTGGGAFMNHTNRVEISNHGVAVWMRVEVNLLWARVKLRSNRPLLQTDNPYQTLVELYKARAPIYAKAPIHVTAYSNYAVDDMVRSVIEHLAEHKDVLEISPYDGPERRRRRRR